MRGRGSAGRMAMRRGGRQRGAGVGRGGALSRGAARGVPRGQGLIVIYFNSAYLCSTSELSFLISIQNSFIHTGPSHNSARLKALHVTVETLH